MIFHPSITDYTATLENPAGVFRTLFSNDDAPVFERNVYGELAFRAGNSAAVFTYYPNTISRRSGVDFVPLSRERRVLKLYLRPNPYLREIYDYVATVVETKAPGSAILPRLRLLRDELFVLSPSGASGWVDVVEGEWVEGVTLDSVQAFIGVSSESLDTPARPNSLIEAFEDLCAQLRAAEWAHGDLKPENIVVRSDGRMTLIDCDAMWIPAFGERCPVVRQAHQPLLAGRPAVELGTPPWSARANSHSTSAPAPFDKSIDDYPMARISEWLSLRK